MEAGPVGERGPPSGLRLVPVSRCRSSEFLPALAPSSARRPVRSPCAFRLEALDLHPRASASAGRWWVALGRRLGDEDVVVDGWLSQ
jgi:hypothetical protein